MKTKKITTLRGAAAEIGVNAGTLSRWTRCDDFPADAVTPHGWNITKLIEYKARRRARSLNPVEASNGDPETVRLCQERDRLRVGLLQLRTLCMNAQICDRLSGRGIVERAMNECKQSLRSAVTAPGGMAYDHKLYDRLLYETFGLILEHMRP